MLVNAVLMSVARVSVVCNLFTVSLISLYFLIGLPICDQSVICGRETQARQGKAQYVVYKLVMIDIVATLHDVTGTVSVFMSYFSSLE
jgi:hypothetical protein